MNEKYLRKIKKCLDLASSSNPHEAAAALQKAKMYMQKYGLSEDDIEFISLGKTQSSEPIPSAMPKYISNLIFKIGQLYQSSGFSHREAGKKQKCYAIFVGSKSNSALAAYTFDVVYRLLKKARREYSSSLDSDRKAWKNRMVKIFCESWVYKVCENLEMDNLPEETSKKHNEFLTKALDTEIHNKRSRKVKEDITLDDILAARAGRDSAEDVSLLTPMEGTETLKITHEGSKY